jgi:hypothetical protein
MSPGPRLIRFVAAIVPFVVLAAAGPAAGSFDSRETENLRLIYNHLTLSYLEPHTARCFENSLRFHKRLFGYTPGEPVTVILDDFGDYSNAGVWVAPRNSMSVHVAPSNNVYETGPSNERIYFTMNHEAVHVVALDMATGYDRFWRTVFGGKVKETPDHPETMIYSHLTLPRRSAPRWYHEGIAVFLETWMAGGYGRAQGPYDEMVFRAMVRDSTRFYDPLGLESEGTKVDFQVGVNSYLYGTRFMSYLAYHYGPEKLIEWVARRPGSSGFYSAQFRKVFGLPLGKAWRDWINFEHGFQQANLGSIRKYPTTAFRDLATEALGSVSRACYDSSSGKLYVAVQYPGTVAHIAAIDVATGRMSQVREVKGPALYFVTSLALNQKQGLLFYTTNNNEWRDLCVIDLKTGDSRVLQKRIRVGDLTVNPADESLWGVRHFNGISTLVRIPPPYTEWTQIYSWPYGQDLYDLDISPDGRRLTASVAEISGRQTLRLFDLGRLADRDTTAQTLFDFGSSIPTSFVFSPDGKYLFGSSYYTGVSNIFRYDLAADSMDIVTNAETGFFRPLSIGADSLLIFRYTGKGFVPAFTESRPLTDVSAITFLGNEIVKAHPVVKEWAVPSPASINIDSLTTFRGRYGSTANFGLAAGYPVIQGYKDYAAVGWHLDFSDPIQLQRLELTASYTPDHSLPGDERLHLKLKYERSSLTATFNLNGADFYDLFGPTKSSRKGKSLGLAWSRSLIYDKPRTMDLRLSVTGFTGLDRHPLYQNVATSPGFSRLVSGSVDLRDRNQRSSLGSVDYEKGYAWGLTTRVNSVRLESGDDIDWQSTPLFIATLDVGRPLPLANSSIWVRLGGGWSPGARNNPFANFFFGGFGNNWVDRSEPKRYRDFESFPGIEIDAAGGTKCARAMIDWNLPPLRFSRVGTADFYASWLRSSIFAATLTTDPDRSDLHRQLFDVGAQIDLRFTALSHNNLTLSLGCARAFESGRKSDDEFMVSLKIL